MEITEDPAPKELIQPDPPKKIVLGNLKSTTKIPRLSSFNGDAESLETDTNANDEDNKDEAISSRNQPFLIKDLQNVWKEFASLRRKKGKAQEQHIFVQPFILNPDGFTITLELNNSLQTDILEEIKSDLVQFLRNKLQNDLIVLESTLKKENGKKMLYTNQEKLNYMADKNPAVADLQNKLGLDPDY